MRTRPEPSWVVSGLGSDFGRVCLSMALLMAVVSDEKSHTRRLECADCR